MRDSLAYIQIFVPHLECEILKTITEESVGWTKAILIDNLKERPIEFCDCILFPESNHGCLFTATMMLFRKFSTWFDVKFSIVHPTLLFFVFSSQLGLKKIVFLTVTYFSGVFFRKIESILKIIGAISLRNNTFNFFKKVNPYFVIVPYVEQVFLSGK